ncbi:MAG: amidohydrolase [Acidobacteriota bacterium]
MLKRLIVSLLGVTLAVAASAAEDAAEILLRHGVFHTESGTASPTVEGSLAMRAGRIVYLGPDVGAQAFAGKQTRQIELAGRAVTPGLIDAHSHLTGYAFDLGQVDLRDSRTFDEVVERVRLAAAKAPAGAWVRGRGWDQNLWPGKQFPTHEALSGAVADHPVYLTRIDGHAALINAAAMKVLGIVTETPDPSGGRYLRLPDGSPSGVLVDRAMDAVESRLPEPTAAELMPRLRQAAANCLAVGLTTVTDMGVSEREIALYDAAVAEGGLPLRVSVFLSDEDALLADWLPRGPRLDPSARLQIRGIKMYADGALGSRGAALVEPYSDDSGNMGLLVTPGDHMAAVAEQALARGFQVAVHAIGDRGNLVALDALERALGGPRPDVRWRIEHAQILRLQDIERMAKLGIIASMQPTHATSDMGWAPDRLGPYRLIGAYAWRKVLRAGGQLALGSDFPVESIDPRLGIYSAVTRQDRAGNPAGGWLPGERLTREEALRGFTLDAARSLFWENEIGSLEVGKRADLVVFASDPLDPKAVPDKDLATVPVDMTFVDGRIVYERASNRTDRGKARRP